MYLGDIEASWILPHVAEGSRVFDIRQAERLHASQKKEKITFLDFENLMCAGKLKTHKLGNAWDDSREVKTLPEQQAEKFLAFKEEEKIAQRDKEHKEWRDGYGSSPYKYWGEPRTMAKLSKRDRQNIILQCLRAGMRDIVKKR